MFERLQQRVAHIQAQPEHVRMRYVLLCLGVSMAFILLIWFFSIAENFGQLRQGDAPELPLEEFKKPEGTSLDQLLQGGAPLEINGEEKSAEQYLKEQQELMRQSQESSIPSQP